MSAALRMTEREGEGRSDKGKVRREKGEGRNVGTTFVERGAGT
jgi:hypothetical protein